MVEQTTEIKREIPNSTAVLVLGICSIPMCLCCGGLVGLVLGIVGLVMGNKGQRLYEESPDSYTAGSYSNLKAGKVCAIIGIILSAITFMFVVIYYSILGTAIFSGSELYWKEIFEQY